MKRVIEMELSVGATMVLFAAVFFACGWGWGQWWAERNARQERRALEVGRIAVSMPADPQDAALTLQLLSALVLKAEAERGKKPAKAE
jgi:hypothetical protein